MADNSKIEWTDATWPVVQGCDPVSQACVHCYAVPLLWRMQHNPDGRISGPLEGVTEKHVNAAGEVILRFTGKVALRYDRLDWPLKWKQPRMIFVPSHGDLFHKDVPDAFIDRVFARMALARWHTFQVLTKRDERMRKYCSDPLRRNAIELAAEADHPSTGKPYSPKHCFRWPLPNVWLGVSAGCQEEADERIPHLLQTPAAVRFVSAEPLLGPIDLTWLHGAFDKSGQRQPMLEWVIVGGESGPQGRPMHPDWARSSAISAKPQAWRSFSSGMERISRPAGTKPERSMIDMMMVAAAFLAWGLVCAVAGWRIGVRIGGRRVHRIYGNWQEWR